LQIQATLLALQAWSDVAGLTFVRQNDGSGFSDNATILFGNYSSGEDGAAAFAYLPGSSAASAVEGDVWVNASLSYNAGPVLWGYGQFALVHEIGHALGLLHPADYDAAPGVDITYAAHATYYEDSNQFTVMSYFSESATGAGYGTGRYAAAPLLDDIAAAQRLYGANMTTRTGDTVYGFNSTADRSWFSASGTGPAPIFAVWDAGGIDTLDFSGYDTRQLIDLRQGAFSNMGSLIGNVSIALGAVIENAIGGAGDDIINGNSADNRITSGAGHNDVEGGLGTDTLVLAGPRSAYTITSDGRRGFIAGPEGTTRIENVEFLAFSDMTIAAPPITGGLDVAGDMTDDRMDGTDFGDTLFGGGGDDLIHGLGGVDQLTGGRGDDLIDGGTGNDLIYIDQGDDNIAGGEGVDVLSADLALGGMQIDLQLGTISGGGMGVDRVSGIERVTGSRFNDLIIGGDEDNYLEGQGGIDTLRGGGGDDELIASSALAGGGADVIKAANQANSTIASAISLDAAFDILERPDIFNSYTNPHATVVATSHGGLEYYAFTVAANVTATFDIDGAAFDSTLRIFDAAGVELSSNDDFRPTGDGGSATDSFLNFRFATAGVYYVQVGQFAPAGGSGFGTAPPAAGLSYTLHVSVPGHAVQPTYNQGSELHGDAGNDLLRSSYGNDNMDGGSGLDTAVFAGVRTAYAVTIADGVTTVTHSDGSVDTLRNVERLQFSDGIYNAAGRPFGGPINGTAAADELYGTAGNDVINGLDGADLIDGGAGNDAISAGLGNDTVHGGAGNDVISGDGGSDVLHGDDGDDAFLFAVGEPGGSTQAFGGAGTDTIILRGGGASIDLTTNGGSAGGVAISVNSIENIQFDGSVDAGGGNRLAYGSAGNNAIVALGILAGVTFEGRGGDDLLIGGGGADTLLGGDGSDNINGADGNDTIEGGAGADHLLGGLGADWIYGGTGNDVISGDGGSDVLLGEDGDDAFLFAVGEPGGSTQAYGGSGTDTVILRGGGASIDLTTSGGSAGAVAISVNSIENVQFDGSVDSGGGARLAYGSAVANALVALGILAPVTFEGRGGDDLLVGGDGADSLSGGADNDIIKGNGGNDAIDGGSGTDLVELRGLAADYVVTAEGGGYRVTDAVGGRDGSDLLTGVETLRFSDGSTVSLPASAPAVPQVMPALAGDKTIATGPEVLPAMDDGFVLTVKFAEGPPVMPTPTGDLDPGLTSASEPELTRELLLLFARENLDFNFPERGPTLPDDWSGIITPSRDDLLG
jgi:serralysin